MNVKKIMPVFLAALIMLPVTPGTGFVIFLRNVAKHWRRCVLPLPGCGKIIMTLIGMRRRYGRAAGRHDPKEAALAAARCLNPHPEQVTDPEFLGSDFFDARDAVQVKYEMVRKVLAGGAPVTEATAAFGYSRPAYYAAAAALESAGLEGLVPARPGPRGAHKLTEEILAWAEEQLAAGPALRPARLPDTDQKNPGRPRAPPVGRESAGPPPGAPFQKPLTCPPPQERRMTRPCPCSPHLATRLLEPGARLNAGQDSAPGGVLDTHYEQLRHAALHARAEAFPLGLGVLTQQGRHCLAACPGQPGPRAATAGRRPPPGPPRSPPGSQQELISALAAVALAGAIAGPAP